MGKIKRSEAERGIEGRKIGRRIEGRKVGRRIEEK